MRELATIDAPFSYTGVRPYPPPTLGYRATKPPWWQLERTLHWCEHAPLDEISRPDDQIRVGASPSPDVLWYDQATGKTVRIDKRQICKEGAVLAPDPGGEIGASFHVANAHAEAGYYKILKSDGPEGPAGQRVVISQEEARARIAEQRKQRAKQCTANAKAGISETLCFVPGGGP
jgi:hypothetical protein